jgi:hypothetical protein
VPELSLEEALLVLVMLIKGVSGFWVPFSLNKDLVGVPVLREIREKYT